MSLIKPQSDGIALVKKLLTVSHNKFDILYQVNLSNHLPHALYSLVSLGASPLQTQEYYDNYTKKFEPLRATGFEINLSNAWNYMGDKKAYPEYLAFFDKEIVSRGVAGCMATFFPKLIGLSLGQGLTPLLRVGYGLEFKDNFVLSEGFSFACTHPLEGSSILVEVEPKVNPEEWCSVEQILQNCRTMETPIVSQDVINVHDKMEFVITEWVELRDLLESWDHSWPEEDSDDQNFSKKLNELTEASILLTFATHPTKIDFLLGSTLTGSIAVQSIIPHLSKFTWKRSLLLANLLGVLTTFVIQGKPEIKLDHVTDYTPNNEDMTLDGIFAQAITSGKENIAEIIRALIMYKEKGPVGERGSHFTDSFLKKCAIKLVESVEDVKV